MSGLDGTSAPQELAPLPFSLPIHLSRADTRLSSHSFDLAQTTIRCPALPAPSDPSALPILGLDTSAPSSPVPALPPTFSRSPPPTASFRRECTSECSVKYEGGRMARIVTARMTGKYSRKANAISELAMPVKKPVRQ